MAVSISSVAALGRLESQIQRSSLWGGSQPIIRYSPVLPPSIKKVRAGKWSTPMCTLQINRPSTDRDLPRSPGKSGRLSTGTAVVIPAKAPSTNFKGWTDATGMQDQRLAAQFAALAALASDRSEMHTVIANQPNNWNSLFHSTITMASVSAAAAAAMNGAQQALGLSVVASILGLGVAALMVLVNSVQPSQMAEEQRHASRFFKRLTQDIEATLETYPPLREEASQYWEQKVGTLQALDSAFPLPLTPGIALEKFPKVVPPSILSGPRVDLSTRQVRTSSAQYTNGWTSAAEKELNRASQLLHASDIPTYIEMATGVNHLNKILAVTSPLLAASGALCSMAGAMQGMLHVSGLGAAFTVGALFVHSLSHAVQLGAAYETYRNCAGYYADIERSIEKALRLPVQQREDGRVFLERISLLLGRSPAQGPLVPADQAKAGTLF